MRLLETMVTLPESMALSFFESKLPPMGMDQDTLEPNAILSLIKKIF
jgi:hypothetical protein